MRMWGPICVLVCFIALATYYWKRVVKEDAAYDQKWFVTWIVKGLVLPIFVWVLLNSGHTPVMPGLIKIRQARPTSGMVIPGVTPKITGVGPITYVAIQTGPALVAVSSFWVALTLAWFILVYVRGVEEPRGFVISSLVWCALMLPFVGLMVAVYGLGGLGFGLLIWFWPMMHYVMLLEPPVDPTPHYTQAIVKLKFGKYSEAEAAIIEELEKCENDFDGWMMLAELYARQFNDLSEAEGTIRDICKDPATTVSQIAVALHKLADWHLQYRKDPVAARQALEDLCRRMPGTHLATMARHRINQLPASRKELEAQHGRPIQLPEVINDLDDTAEKNSITMSPDEASRAADVCVEKLKRDPNDVASREKLARIFAEQLGQASLALEQLELLIEIPGQPEKKMAEWLALMATWQLKYRNDRDAACKILQRLIQDYPQSPQAFAGQRKLILIERTRRGSFN